MEKIRNHTFKKLLIWQKALALVTLIYNEIKVFPPDEFYALSSQIKKSAASTSSNIAEGYGRDGIKDNLRFLNIALSSLFKLQTQLEMAYNMNFIKKDNFERLYEDSREI